MLLEDDSIVKSSTYKVNIEYKQRGEEPLDYFSVTLYTYQKTELSSSGNIYNTSDLSHLISKLENAKQYYIRATGKTLHSSFLWCIFSFRHKNTSKLIILSHTSLKVYKIFGILSE